MSPTPNAAPVISVQPVSVTTETWTTATFSVAASGNPAPTYQWLKNGVAVPGWTWSSLVIEGVSWNDMASYQVVVSNWVGSVNSDVVALTIGTAPAPVVPSP